VLLAEAVIPPGNEFSFGKLLDLEMLTLPGAIERTEEARVPALCSAAHVLVLRPAKENSMPRQRSLVTVIRDLVQQEVRSAIQSLFSTVSPSKPATNGRRRRRKTRGTWRPGGPGRPPMAVAEKMAQKRAAAATSGAKAKTVRRRRRRARSAGSKRKAA